MYVSSQKFSGRVIWQAAKDKAPTKSQRWKEKHHERKIAAVREEQRKEPEGL